MLLLKQVGVWPLISGRAESGPWLTENQPFKQKGVKHEEGFLFISVLTT